MIDTGEAFRETLERLAMDTEGRRLLELIHSASMDGDEAAARMMVFCARLNGMDDWEIVELLRAPSPTPPPANDAA